MKKENEDIFDKIGIALGASFFVLLALASVFLMLKFFFTNFVVCLKMFAVIAIIAGFCLLICRKPFAAYLKEVKENRMKKRKETEEKKMREDAARMQESIDSIRYLNMPQRLSEAQRRQLLAFQEKARNYICAKYFLANCLFPDSEEKQYALLFLNNQVITVKCYYPASEEFVELYLRTDKQLEFKFLNEDCLSNLVREQVSDVPAKSNIQKKKRTSNKVKKLRAERKAKKSGNIIIKNGKKYQKPNYPFFAKEWTAKNMGYLNKMVMDSSKAGEKQVVFVVPSDKLPEDRNTWSYIGQRLKDDDEIDNYVVVSDGLKLIIDLG